MERPKQRIRLYPTIEDRAVEILAEAGVAMNYRELADKIQEKRPIGGRTPKKSVYAVLIRSERVRPVGNGYFVLVERANKSQLR